MTTTELVTESEDLGAATTLSRPPSIGVSMLGMGVVGSAVATALGEKDEQLAQQTGQRFSLDAVLVRDIHKERSFKAPHGLLFADPEAVIGHPNTSVVVEVMGGERPALDYILKSISLGKHVVTANKAVMARHGAEILSAAAGAGVQVLFEGSVAAGTPVVSLLSRGLAANDVVSMRGIINGTTNFVLTKMEQHGLSLEAALAEARELGYAEADASSDVEGTDAAYKLAILAGLAWGARVSDADVFREGIGGLEAVDFEYAKELGCTIKPVAIASRQGGSIQLRVHPALLRRETSLGRVDGVFNALEVEADLAGPVLLQGHGAGGASTASAVVADLIEVARSIATGARPSAPHRPDSDAAVSPISELQTRYYLRLTVEDDRDVEANVAAVLGDLGVEVESRVRRRTPDDVELVVMTARANEAAVQIGVQRLHGLDAVGDVKLIRVEDPDG